MKYILILGDGMADYPVPALGHRTPLMAADKPSIDRIAALGRTGLFRAIEPDMPTGSAVANLSVLGYDPKRTFRGRGVLEAASMGISLELTDMAMRANLITVENGSIKSHSAGHIDNKEAGILIKDLSGAVVSDAMKLYQGLSYRHLLVMPHGDSRLDCAPPHDHLDENIAALFPKPLHEEAAKTAETLISIIKTSMGILKDHPVNRRRISKGRPPANCLWPWSPGTRPAMTTLNERFGITGAAISAVDLIKGLAVYAGLDVVPVKGATGLYDTNYEGKAEAAISALETHDFVFVHVEAADEAGHEKNIELKVKCIEDLDRRLVKPLLEVAESWKDKTAIAVLPDHPTPVNLGSHTRDPVPVAVWIPGNKPDNVDRFDEESVKSGSLGLLRGDQFIKTLFAGRSRQ